MSEKEKQLVEETARIYTHLPEYLKGKLDGYAEALKEQRAKEEKEDREKQAE